MNYSIWPVKKLSKFLIVWTFPDHNGTSCRSLKVPISSFNLAPSNFRSVN